MLKQITNEQRQTLWDDGYAEYIMAHAADAGEVFICNGDDLLVCMESEYMWDEYLASKGLVDILD